MTNQLRREMKGVAVEEQVVFFTTIESAPVFFRPSFNQLQRKMRPSCVTKPKLIAQKENAHIFVLPQIDLEMLVTKHTQSV